MTISSTSRKAGPYFGNDATVSFGFGFTAYDSLDVQAVVTSLSTGAETVLAYGVDYTVSVSTDQDNNPGGTVSLVAGPLASGYKITLLSNIAPTQSVVFTNLGGFFPALLNKVVDRLTALVQQVQARALRMPLTADDDVSNTLPAPVPSTFIGWDATGKHLVAYAGITTTTSPIGTFAVAGVNADITQLSALAVVPSVVLATYPGRNRLINGAFDVDQRNSGAQVSVSAGYGLDRWRVDVGGGASVKVQQLGTPGARSMKVNTVGPVSSLRVEQRIEAAHAADLAGKTVTLSITGTSNIGGTFPVRVAVANNPDDFSAVTLISSTPVVLNATTTTARITVALPAGAANGISVRIIDNTAGLLSNAQFTFTSVQLEEGPAGSAFDRQPLALELLQCARYFQRMVLPRASAYLLAGSEATVPVCFLPMRTGPTVSAITAPATTNCTFSVGFGSGWLSGVVLSMVATTTGMVAVDGSGVLGVSAEL
jgi:hypothetical protein